MDVDTPCCPCDELIHPRKPDIAAGLNALPRQIAGFPEYRLAMLRDIPNHRPLDDWRAREGDDFGIMLLEMWAYVLDVLGFYDERIANETYLRSAARRPSLRRLVELIGYRPRPALAASVILAAIADGQQPVSVPAFTGFRSQAFDDEPPQVFESSRGTIIHPTRNQWTLAPVRPALVGDGDLLLEAATAGLRRDQLVLFAWGVTTRISQVFPGLFTADLGSVSNQSDGLSFVGSAFEFGQALVDTEKNFAISGQPIGPALPPAVAGLVFHDPPAIFRYNEMTAGRVASAEPIEALDGGTYVKLQVTPVPSLDEKIESADVQVFSPSLSATVNKFGGTSAYNFPLSTQITLDALYSQITLESLVIVERGDEYWPAQVTNAGHVNVSIGEAVAPVTSIWIQPQLPNHWINQQNVSRLVIHFNMVDGGNLTRVANTRLDVDDLQGGARLLGPVEPLDAGSPNQVLLHDANERGERVGGKVAITPDGKGTLSVNQDQQEFAQSLRTPVQAHGNLIPATRGESVFNEVLGSGDAAQTFQSFALADKPLTYLNDASAPDGRRSTLTIRVNGLLWSEVPSFFGISPTDEVYIVRENDDEESIVTFGDGVRGARIPTGIDNVIANYRSGAGASKPPANSITQLATPVDDLRAALNPVAAGGGADRDRPEDIRKNAATSSLTLGRAISALDFQALASEFGGVINTQVDWAWDQTCQRAVVKVWYISDGGQIRQPLRGYLIGQAEPNTPLRVCEATAVQSDLIIDLVIDRRFDSDEVEIAVANTLAAPDGGVLALCNIVIGCPIFRSAIFEQVLSVQGVVSVRAMTVDGKPAPNALTVAEGHYRNFLPTLRVGNTNAGDMLFAQAITLHISNLPAFVSLAAYKTKVQALQGPLLAQQQVTSVLAAATAA